MVLNYFSFLFFFLVLASMFESWRFFFEKEDESWRFTHTKSSFGTMKIWNDDIQILFVLVRFLSSFFVSRFLVPFFFLYYVCFLFEREIYLEIFCILWIKLISEVGNASILLFLFS